MAHDSKSWAEILNKYPLHYQQKNYLVKSRSPRRGSLFHQSGGCCDGSAPMCFPAKEIKWEIAM